MPKWQVLQPSARALLQRVERFFFAWLSPGLIKGVSGWKSVLRKTVGNPGSVLGVDRDEASGRSCRVQAIVSEVMRVEFPEFVTRSRIRRSGPERRVQGK